MNRLEWARISIAIIGALVLVFVGRGIGVAFYPVEHLTAPVYQIEGVSTWEDVDLATWHRSWPGSVSVQDRERLFAYMNDLPEEIIGGSEGVATTAAVPKVEIPLPNLLASADVARGQDVARKCKACHTFGEGGRNQTGPNLWNIVGNPRARIAEFNYTDAMQQFGGEWSLESLFEYLVNPRKYIAGTNMSFAGLRKAGDRANLIVYLRSLSDSPVPLPASVDVPEATDMTDAANTQ